MDDSNFSAAPKINDAQKTSRAPTVFLASARQKAQGSNQLDANSYLNSYLNFSFYLDSCLGAYLDAYLHLPFFTAASCAAQALVKSGAVATRVQPVPIGFTPLFHQIRQKPSSKRTTEKSALAGVEAVKPSANTPTAKTKRFIVSPLLCLPGNFSIVRAQP